MTRQSLRVGVRELKNETSAILRRVRAGESVIVTDRGAAFAVIVPHAERAPDPVLALIAEGRVTWGGGKPRGSARPARLRGPTVADAVLEDRR